MTEKKLFSIKISLKNGFRRFTVTVVGTDCRQIQFDSPELRQWDQWSFLLSLSLLGLPYSHLYGLVKNLQLYFDQHQCNHNNRVITIKDSFCALYTSARGRLYLITIYGWCCNSRFNYTWSTQHFEKHIRYDLVIVTLLTNTFAIGYNWYL